MEYKAIVSDFDSVLKDGEKYVITEVNIDLKALLKKLGNVSINVHLEVGQAAIRCDMRKIGETSKLKIWEVLRTK